MVAPVLLAVAEVVPVLVAPGLVAEEAEVAISPAEEAVVLLAVAETALVLLGVKEVAISSAAQAVDEALLEKHALKHRQHEFPLVDEKAAPVLQSEEAAVASEVAAMASDGQSEVAVVASPAEPADVQHAAQHHECCVDETPVLPALPRCREKQLLVEQLLATE